MKAAATTLLALVLAAQPGCSREHHGKNQDGATSIEAATDVFWALQREGYAVAKEKPLKSRHGCSSSEYRAAKEGAVFKISVFKCGDAARAAGLAGDEHYKHIDALLRNHHEGGVLRRGAFIIIVRKETGTAGQADALMTFLSSL